MYSFKVMDNVTAEKIIDWHYNEPYHFYDLSSNNAEFASWENNLKNNDWKDTYSIISESSLIGFFKITKEEDCLALKLGINPLLTGKKLGSRIIEEILEFIKDKYKDTAKDVIVTIPSFDKRAFKLFDSLGFKLIKHVPHSVNGVFYDCVLLTKEI